MLKAKRAGQTHSVHGGCFQIIPINDGCFPSSLAALYIESQDEEPDYVNTDPALDPTLLSKQR